MKYVNSHTDTIRISKDKNLEDDPHFYARKKELAQIRTDIKNDTTTLLSFDDFEKKTNQLEKELELKYAH